MHTVKRLEKNTVLDRTAVNAGKIKAIGHKVTHTSYAVVDTSGEVAKGTSGEYEVYSRKATAQQVANWYNERDEQPA